MPEPDVTDIVVVTLVIDPLSVVVTDDRVEVKHRQTDKAVSDAKKTGAVGGSNLTTTK